MLVLKRALAAYGGAVLVVAMATLVRLALDPVLGNRVPLMPYVFAVAIVAWYWGQGPGWVTLLLGGVVAVYLFVPPRGTLRPSQPESVIGVGLYLATGAIIVLLASAQRSARRSAEAATLEALDRQAKLEAEIARRERAEGEREALLAEQARLRAASEAETATLACLVDQAPLSIVFYDPDLRLLRANALAAARLGRPPDQLLGRGFREAMEGLLPGAEVDAVERIYREALETGEPFVARGWTSRIRRPGVAPSYVDWNLRRVERPEGGTLGLLGTFADATEDIEREVALRRSEERFRLAAEAVVGHIYDADAATGHVERTQGLFDLIGYQPEEVPPTIDWWLEQVHPDDLDKFPAVPGHRASSRSRSVIEYRIRHRDGRYLRVVDRSLAMTDAAGRVVRLVGCTQDVTEVREAEEALREADARKNEFLAVLAHEIRNPLASIRNSLRLMRPGQGEGRAPDLDFEAGREVAERQVAHLARIVDDLMDVSRIGRGQVELRKEPVELAGVVGRAVEALRATIDRRGHALSVELPGDPIRLEADPTRLEQVFGNLLNNAAKYTPPGGRIAVSAREEGGEAVLTVVDNGLGISAEMLPRVFEMFVQDGRHAGHAQGGLGIGLGLSRSLVELHGGRISARSDGPGSGTEFQVRLPLAAGGVPSPDGASRPGRPAPAPRRRVLVVDDNEDVARSLAKVLERMYGQEVRVAHDGPSALELAEGFLPELILLDIGMPEMDGCEVARQIRRRPEFASTLLVALTGWGQDSDRRRSEEAGIDRHLVKPVDPDDLGELIAASRT